MSLFPDDPKERKKIQLFSGLLQYFPRALIEVAKVSWAGNAQHNGPDTPLVWSKGKSNDHADCLLRHLMAAGSIDSDGCRHSGKLAWRALALLETELEKGGAA